MKVNYFFLQKHPPNFPLFFTKKHPPFSTFFHKTPFLQKNTPPFHFLPTGLYQPYFFCNIHEACDFDHRDTHGVSFITDSWHNYYLLFRECCSRCRLQQYDCISIRFFPPSSFVDGHVSTTWFVVCRWPQSQEGDWVRPRLCKLAQHEPWPVQKRFIRDCVWRGRWKPGCWIVG